MPNTENIRAWVDALRSGDYAQAEGALNDGRGNYCCLGVACEVARAAGVVMEVTTKDRSGHVTYDGLTGILPNAVVEWLGVSDNDPPLPNTPATSLNDDHGWSFDDIADAIESTFLANEPS